MEARITLLGFHTAHMIDFHGKVRLIHINLILWIF